MLETAVLSGGGLLFKHWSELSQFWLLVCIWFTGFTLSLLAESLHIWPFDIYSASQKMTCLQYSVSYTVISLLQWNLMYNVLISVATECMYYLSSDHTIIWFWYYLRIHISNTKEIILSLLTCVAVIRTDLIGAVSNRGLYGGSYYWDAV